MGLEEVDVDGDGDGVDGMDGGGEKGKDPALIRARRTMLLGSVESASMICYTHATTKVCCTTIHHSIAHKNSIASFEDLHCDQSIPILYVYAGHALASRPSTIPIPTPRPEKARKQ